MALDPYFACRSELDSIYASDRAAFRALFHEGSIDRAGFKFDIGALRELGLIEDCGEILRAKVAITQFEGTFIATDFIHSRALDRVFPVYPDESYLLAMWPTIREDDVVLDLCTGSGIIAIIAKKRGASRVLASDITERSRTFFDLNVRLNQCEDVEFVHSDVRSDIPDTSFTLVTCNPPFVPVPDGHHYFVHSDGGRLGTSLVEHVLEQTEPLRHKARLYMTCLSLGTEASWRVETLCRRTAKAPDGRAKWKLQPLYDDPSIPFTEYVGALPAAQLDQEWVDTTTGILGYDRLGYFGLAMGGPERQPSTAELGKALGALNRSPPFGPLDKFCWSMRNRLRRYNAHVA